MLGSFNLPSVGSFIVSGDNPEEFLWDLFDQIVIDGNVNINSNAINITIHNTSGVSQDTQERIDARGTKEWIEAHSSYFCNKINEGTGFYMEMPIDCYYGLHKISLLGHLVNQGGERLRVANLKNNIARSRFGNDSNEFKQSLKDNNWNDYPYPDTNDVNFINYLIIKGALNVRVNDGIPFVTQSEVIAINSNSKKEIEKLIEEQRNAAIEAKQREKLKGRKKTNKK